MKLALLSDIHANLQAFDACLAHAQAVGAQRYALLGDLVGYFRAAEKPRERWRVGTEHEKVGVYEVLRSAGGPLVSDEIFD